MEKKISFLICACLIFVINGCENMMDVHKEYIKEGETSYSVKIDSVYICPGENRIDIEGFLKNGLQVKKIRIKWFDTEKNEYIEEIPYDYDTSPERFNCRFPIQEGQYLFEITSVNQEENSSIPILIDGKVYGEKYKRYLQNRRIEQVLSHQSGGISVLFGNKYENLIISKLKYKTNSGEEITIEIEPTEWELLITDIDLDAPIYYQSGYLPTPNAIDTLFCKEEVLDWSTLQPPATK